jgi:adenylate cyclase
MPREIERKFLLKTDAWRGLAERHQRMSQGYIAGNERASVRVRIAGKEAWLNIKCGGFVASRPEFEYAIPIEEAHELLDFTAGPRIEKTRHWVRDNGFTWEIDEFHGANEGLIVAEIELEREDIEVPQPAWVGDEVTHLRRYYNVCLVDHPFSTWSDEERQTTR